MLLLVRLIIPQLIIQYNNIFVKVSKAFKKSVARWLDLTTLGSKDKHLNLLSHGGMPLSINPGTTIPYIFIIVYPVQTAVKNKLNKLGRICGGKKGKVHCWK